MARLTLALGIAGFFSLACTGGMPGMDAATDTPPATDAPKDAAPETDKEAEKDKETPPANGEIIVPMPPASEGREWWCCEYDADGTNPDGSAKKAYGLVAGPSDCAAKFGTKNGKYVQNNSCIPCCCESDKDKSDASAGKIYEVTTPGLCQASGTCAAWESHTDTCTVPPADPTAEPKPVPDQDRDPVDHRDGGHDPQPTQWDRNGTAPQPQPAPEGKAGKQGKNH